MPEINLIAAIDENNAIGKNNQLLCHLPNDLKYFKSVTEGNTVIMGRNTYMSLPNGALPKRRNIVLSKNPDLKIENAETAFSLQQAIEKTENEEQVFIIGGGSVYKEAIDIADKLYITLIHHRFEGADTFFPDIDDTIWEEISRKENPGDEKNKYAHTFIIYRRK
ncbi:MAG TPA: dihydrofolate reductase [Dysgonomonas sp.]|nr:dihydrofolate reductase [Dysgonomonas sp.]